MKRTRRKTLAAAFVIGLILLAMGALGKEEAEETPPEVRSEVVSRWRETDSTLELFGMTEERSHETESPVQLVRVGEGLR